MTDWVDEAIKELAKETADYTKPESFSLWCDLVAPRFNQNGSTVFEQVEERMKRIHTLSYLDNLQKVQLVFVFSQPMSFAFKMILHRNHHHVKLDKYRRIVRFSSNIMVSGRYKRSVEDRTLHFQGKPIHGCQDTQGPPISSTMNDSVNRAIKELAKKTADHTKPENLFFWCRKIGPSLRRNGTTLHHQVKDSMQEIQNITYLDDLQKVQLLFVFSRPVNDCFHTRLLREGHEIELNNRRHIVLFRSKDGKYRRSVEEYIQGEPSLDLQDTQGHSPSDQDLQNDALSSSGAHSLRGDSTSADAKATTQDLPPDGPSSSGARGYFADDSTAEQKPIVFGGSGTPNFPVFVYNSVKEERMEDFENEQYGEAPSSSRDFSHDRYGVSVDGPMASGSGDLHNLRLRTDPARAPVHKEILLNPRQRQMAEKYIAENYSHGVTQQQRRNIEARFAAQHAEVDEMYEVSRIPVASPARKETPGTKRRLESELAQVKRSKPSTENRGSTRRSISSSSSDDDVIIIEPQFVSFTSTPSSKSAPEDSRVAETSHNQELSPISALKLAEQIETIAHFLNLKDLQAKTARIVQELQIENKAICPKRFHREMLSVWASVDDAKVKNHVGESLNAKRFLESLRLCVIRPLGRKLVANSLVYIEKKIKKLEDKKSQKVLPMVKIQENLESLLELAADN